MSGARPRTGPTDNVFWRAACAVPILGSAVWCTYGKHSLPPATGAPPERYFRSPSSGLLVHHRSWLPAGPPRGAIYLLHGLFEHVERYTHVGEFWAKRGFLVFGLDHQGHGQSEGDGGFFSSFDSVVADVLHLAQVALPAPEGVPRFLFGASCA